MTKLDAYTRIDPDKVPTLIEEVNPHLTGTVFPAEETTILTKELSFYKSYTLLDITNHALTPVPRRYVLKSKDKIIPLNFTNEPIYALNQDGALNLNGQNIDEYARFFFEFVHGPKGRFQIVETLDDIEWLQEPSTPERHALAPKVNPISVSQGENGDFILQINVIFKGTLLDLSVEIDKNGTVDIKNQKLKEKDLAVKESFTGSF